ncbi:Hypothetical predicted protein [Mytilus galloprovincialis]|uniref:BZIP domain-containing protein n=1 Tax=Mytilus galloprovincialis TaxID=29158 RepID=A0A8B6C5Q5_MYTGA|nr:Hypothetical predicted protein [Mytilus galloprovincialis]
MDVKENERVFRLPSDAHNFYNDLYDRAKESVARKSILPLLKDELKLKIQTRRLSQGLDELKVDFENKPQMPLTEKEREKQSYRKRCNRFSARKCRIKKKQYNYMVQQELVDLRTTNVQLKDKVFQLETEKEFYISKLFNNPEIMNILTEYYGANLNSLCEVKEDDRFTF